MSNFTPGFWKMTSGFLVIIALGVSTIVLISILEAKTEPAPTSATVDIEIK